MYKEDRHLSRSLSSSSHLSVSTFKLFRSRLHTSLKRSVCRPRLRVPSTSSLYSIDFGILSSPILRTWPSQRSLRWLRVKYIVVSPVRLNTSSLVIFCCHRILRIRRRQRRWKVLIFFTCRLDKVHVSLPYSRVLHKQAQYTIDFVRMLNFGLSQTLAVRRAKVPEKFKYIENNQVWSKKTQYLNPYLNMYSFIYSLQNLNQY